MAGLLDIFGTSGQETLGLLGGDVGRSRDDAQAQALYALAGSLLSGGPTGLSIVKGLQQGQQAYRQAMRGDLEDRLTQFQLQEFKRKQEEEAASRQRKALAQQVLMKGYVPGVAAQPAQEIYGEDIMGQQVGEGMTPAVAAQAPYYDLAKVAPILMAGGAGQEGIDALLKQLNIQKAMTGEPIKVGEGEKVYRPSVFGGKLEEIAVGAPKAEKLTGTEGDAALLLYGTADISKIRAIPGAVDAIRKEAINQRNASKPVINMSDPTAVQAQQLKTINQWEGLLKDQGLNEIASRANGFYNAYGEAKKGNTNADGALIYNVAKLYDPGGVVQAGDINSVVGVRSIPSNIQLLAQKVSKGGTLLPKERENLKNIIDGIVDNRKKDIEPSLKTYRKINKDLGGVEDAIINPLDMIRKPKGLDEILGG